MGGHIIENKIQCVKCKDVIESKHRHDFVWCSCRSCAVDGGKDYLKRIGNQEDWTDLSFVVDAEDTSILAKLVEAKKTLVELNPDSASAHDIDKNITIKWKVIELLGDVIKQIDEM